jgi:hypothetical protein
LILTGGIAAGAAGKADDGKARHGTMLGAGCFSPEVISGSLALACLIQSVPEQPTAGLLGLGASFRMVILRGRPVGHRLSPGLGASRWS